MANESQWIYDRMTLHWLIQAHPQWSARHLAAEVGRSERWARKWIQRFKAVETAHIEMYFSQSRAPKTRPRQTSEVVKDVICEVRETLSEIYHRPAGAPLIRAHLLADEALKHSDHFIPTSSQTISKILRERGYIQSARKRERQPLELCEPMEEWEIDFCEIRLVDGRFEFFIVVDRGTSRVVYLEGCEGYNAETALMALHRLLLLNGLPQRIRLDRDPRFVWGWSADSFPAPLIRLLHAVNVEPVICPPRRPDKKPYVERCIRTFKHEWLGRFSLETMVDCYEALDAFPHYYNSQRLHFGRACQGRTPDAAFPELPRLPQLPDRLDPNRWLRVTHGRVFRRRIRANGTIQVDKHVYYVTRHRAKQAALVHLDADKQCLHVTVDGEVVCKPLPLKDLRPPEMSLTDYIPILQREAMSIAHYRRMMWMQSADVA